MYDLTLNNGQSPHSFHLIDAVKFIDWIISFTFCSIELLCSFSCSFYIRYFSHFTLQICFYVVQVLEFCWRLQQQQKKKIHFISIWVKRVTEALNWWIRERLMGMIGFGFTFLFLSAMSHRTYNEQLIWNWVCMCRVCVMLFV